MKAEIQHQKILIDGKDTLILSGEMHYFRIPREYWRDRFTKLKACGLNTVALYMPWNLHERTPGEFDFSGNLDIAAYLAMAAEFGLHVILRPGPYICSEWEFGGFPAWLLAVKGLRLRCSEPQYLKFVKRYFDAVFEQIRPFFDKNIIVMQIENGYASYGNDRAYYNFLKQAVQESGFTNIIASADGDSDIRIASSAQGTWCTAMLGREDPTSQLEFLRQKHPDEPLMIMEYWNGQGLHSERAIWLRDPEIVVENLEKILKFGAHVNLYMFHGGTTFGFMNGAMKAIGGPYRALTTSYDACAPLTEAGDITGLYLRMRELFARYNPEFDPATIPVPPSTRKTAIGKVELTGIAYLKDNLDALSERKTEFCCPITMEEAGGDFGFVRYTSTLAPQNFPLPVTVYRYQDRGFAFFNGKHVSTFTGEKPTFTVDAAKGGTLEIVIENTGRTNVFCTGKAFPAA